MKLSKFLASLSVFAVAIGCSAAPGDEHAAKPPDESQKRDPYLPAVDPLIRGSVSGTFPMEKPEDCRPLGLPITLFLSDELGVDTLVDETATPTSATECVHEQVLAAPADSWANLAYAVVCGGGGDAALCGAQAMRMCSFELLLRWAEDRTEPVESTGLIFGFKYVIPPLDKATRTSVDRRAAQEVATLIAESYAVISEFFAYTRNCPDENFDEIMRNYSESLDLQRRLSDRLASE